MTASPRVSAPWRPDASAAARAPTNAADALRSSDKRRTSAVGATSLRWPTAARTARSAFRSAAAAAASPSLAAGASRTTSRPRYLGDFSFSRDGSARDDARRASFRQERDADAAAAPLDGREEEGPQELLERGPLARAGDLRPVALRLRREVPDA